MSGEQQPAAVSTASDGQPDDVFRNCRHCGVPVLQPKRRGQVKDFCSDRHRAAFRDAQVQAGIREAQAAIQETRDEIAATRDNLERLDARMLAATQLLERGLRHGTRKPKASQQLPADEKK